MTLIPRVQRGRRRSQIASVVDLSAALFSRGTARLSSEIESETPFPPSAPLRPSFLSTSHQLYHNSNGAPFSSTPRRQQQQLLLSNAAFLSSLSERVNDERTNERSIHCLPAKHLCYAAAAAILIPIFFFSLLPPRCIHFAVTEGEAGSSPLSFPSLCPAFPFIALQYFPSPFYPSDPVTMFAHTPPSLLQSSSLPPLPSSFPACCCLRSFATSPFSPFSRCIDLRRPRK